MDKMNDTRKREKNQHIQVFVRVRPINNAEKIGKSLVVVDVPSNKEVIVKERPQDKLSKKFTFDKVFGPSSKQVDVYSAVVSPLLDEVLAGYNCTVFAYGQTGTGKTFTMEGVSNDPALHWQSDTTAGIIPRSLSHLFDELRLLDAQEYTVRVSFLELYNEELFDLLSPTDDASKIRLYEDASRKGGVIIHGLEEVTVHNKSEVYKILEKGSEKRQTAATLMNAQSSRSHTVFSITVHIKENTVDGEELLKTGKLNLVDLAGSENVGRSGAVDRRAREAGSINQSLLTLGRVITALVERAPHVPYRESKLTRLLQESLGGRTKTSIIATVSPASVNLEETLSTLDYAYRAKNITNRPEINQKLSKKALLKEYTEEIERLRRDLAATRERNGVYLAQESYNEMQATIQYQCKEIEEKINHIKALEENMQAKEKLFLDLQVEHHEQTNVLHKTKNVLETTQEVLKKTASDLKLTELERDVQTHLVEKHVSTEKALLSQATTLLDVADVATTDTHKLHDKIIRKTKVEEENDNLSQRFRKNMAKRFEDIENDLTVYTQELVQFCISMKDQVDTQIKVHSKDIDTTIQCISKDLVNEEQAVTNHLAGNVNDSYLSYQKWLQSEGQMISKMSEDECTLLNDISEKLAPRIRELVHNGIAENLRLLNDDISLKLEHLAGYTKETIKLMCAYRLEERDCLRKNIHEIRENVDNILRNQEQILCKRESCAKAFESFCNQFNELRNVEMDNSFVTSNTLNHVVTICSNINDKASSNCNVNVDKEKGFEDKINKGIEAIKHNLLTETEKNRMLAEKAMVQSNTLVQELQSDLNKGCKTLVEYKNIFESDVQDMQKKSEDDKGTILSSIQTVDKIVTDASVNHVEFMESQRNQAYIRATEMGHRFGNQSIESTEWNNRITALLRTTQHQVEKFLIEDLRRDIPTGSTPVRREFQYPRHLVQTSPHERIIQRFRAARKSVETSDDDDTTLQNTQDITLLNNISPNERTESQIQRTNTSPLLSNNTLCVTSTPHITSCKKVDTYNSMNSIMKCASTSDISIISRPSLDASIRSDTDIYIKNGNKENGEDEFVKPEKTGVKRLSKLKNPNRRVLGTYN